MLVATNRGNRWFFVFGFEKNERANISDAQLNELREYAVELLKLSPANIATMIGTGALQEICHD